MNGTDSKTMEMECSGGFQPPMESRDGAAAMGGFQPPLCFDAGPDGLVRIQSVALNFWRGPRREKQYANRAGMTGLISAASDMRPLLSIMFAACICRCPA
jgi:hypothetical protein